MPRPSRRWERARGAWAKKASHSKSSSISTITAPIRLAGGGDDGRVTQIHKYRLAGREIWLRGRMSVDDKIRSYGSASPEAFIRGERGTHGQIRRQDRAGDRRHSGIGWRRRGCSPPKARLIAWPRCRAAGPGCGRAGAGSAGGARLGRGRRRSGRDMLVSLPLHNAIKHPLLRRGAQHPVVREVHPAEKIDAGSECFDKSLVRMQGELQFLLSETVPYMGLFQEVSVCRESTTKSSAYLT